MIQLNFNWGLKRLQTEDEHPNRTRYSHPQGDVMIAQYVLSTGEPLDYVHLELNKPNGHTETTRAIKPQAAVEFGRTLIRHARPTKNQTRRQNKHYTLSCLGGPVTITQHAWFFGEFQCFIHVALYRPDGPFETGRLITTQDAIELGRELIRHATLKKKLVCRWKKNRTPAYFPI